MDGMLGGDRYAGCAVLQDAVRCRNPDRGQDDVALVAPMRVLSAVTSVGPPSVPSVPKC